MFGAEEILFYLLQDSQYVPKPIPSAFMTQTSSYVQCQPAISYSRLLDMITYIVYITATISGGRPRSMLNFLLTTAELWWLRKPVLAGVDPDRTK